MSMPLFRTIFNAETWRKRFEQKETERTKVWRIGQER
jgi:hypothetical protein